MFDESNFKLKSRLLDELLEDLDSHEAQKLKPRAAVSITEVKPEDESELEIGAADPDSALKSGAPELPGHEDEDDDEDLKMLLEHYMSK